MLGLDSFSVFGVSNWVPKCQWNIWMNKRTQRILAAARDDYAFTPRNTFYNFQIIRVEDISDRPSVSKKLGHWHYTSNVIKAACTSKWCRMVKYICDYGFVELQTFVSFNRCSASIYTMYHHLHITDNIGVKTSKGADIDGKPRGGPTSKRNTTGTACSFSMFMLNLFSAIHSKYDKSQDHVWGPALSIVSEFKYDVHAAFGVGKFHVIS